MPSNPPSPHDPTRGIRRAPITGDVVPSRRRARRGDEDELDEFPSEEDINRFGDVTRTCPECKKKVFDDAALCYHCGHAFERTAAGSTPTKKWVFAVAFLLVTAFVIFALRALF